MDARKAALIRQIESLAELLRALLDRLGVSCMSAELHTDVSRAVVEAESAIRAERMIERIQHDAGARVG